MTEPINQVTEPINQVTERPTEMPLRYEIRSDVMYVQITDVLDAGEILEFYETLAADPDFRPGTPFLVDVRGVEVTAPFPQLQTTSLVSRRADIFATPTKSAALVSSAWMFGVVRQWASVRGEENLETRPFYSEVEARRWLSEPGEGNA